MSAFKSVTPLSLDNGHLSSLLPVFAKVVEKVVYEQRCTYMREMNILSVNKVGPVWIKYRVVVIGNSDEWRRSLDKKDYVIVALLDV